MYRALVCVYVCMCVCVYVCVYVCMCVSVCMCLCVCVSVSSVYACLCVYVRTQCLCVCVFMSVCASVSLCVCVSVCVSVCAHRYVSVCESVQHHDYMSCVCGIFVNWTRIHLGQLCCIRKSFVTPCILVCMHIFLDSYVCMFLLPLLAWYIHTSYHYTHGGPSQLQLQCFIHCIAASFFLSMYTCSSSQSKFKLSCCRACCVQFLSLLYSFGPRAFTSVCRLLHMVSIFCLSSSTKGLAT